MRANSNRHRDRVGAHLYGKRVQFRVLRKRHADDFAIVGSAGEKHAPTGIGECRNFIRSIAGAQRFRDIPGEHDLLECADAAFTGAQSALDIPGAAIRARQVQHALAAPAHVRNRLRRASSVRTATRPFRATASTASRQLLARIPMEAASRFLDHVGIGGKPSLCTATPSNSQRSVPTTGSGADSVPFGEAERDDRIPIGVDPVPARSSRAAGGAISCFGMPCIADPASARQRDGIRLAILACRVACDPAGRFQRCSGSVRRDGACEWSASPPGNGCDRGPSLVELGTSGPG